LLKGPLASLNVDTIVSKRSNEINHNPTLSTNLVHQLCAIFQEMPQICPEMPTRIQPGYTLCLRKDALYEMLVLIY